MNTTRLGLVEKEYLRTDHPEFHVGDTIKVSLNIIEGEKKRIQAFQGIVIGMKNSGIRKTFTIRRISDGVGVERILPLHSPSIAKIEMIKKGHVRKAKLYYMRERIGKQAMFIKAKLEK